MWQWFQTPRKWCWWAQNGVFKKRPLYVWKAGQCCKNLRIFETHCALPSGAVARENCVEWTKWRKWMRKLPTCRHPAAWGRRALKTTANGTVLTVTYWYWMDVDHLGDHNHLLKHGVASQRMTKSAESRTWYCFQQAVMMMKAYYSPWWWY